MVQELAFPQNRAHVLVLKLVQLSAMLIIALFQPKVHFFVLNRKAGLRRTLPRDKSQG